MAMPWNETEEQFGTGTGRFQIQAGKIIVCQNTIVISHLFPHLPFICYITSRCIQSRHKGAGGCMLGILNWIPTTVNIH